MNVLDALWSLRVDELSYSEWIMVGMALKREGFPCSTWDSWSQGDTRYHPGECQRKWETFKDCEKPVTGGTIIKMALDRGWEPYLGESNCLDWNDEIESDDHGNHKFESSENQNPTSELITYLETLFEPDDFVSYVTEDVRKSSDGKWRPGKGVFNRTAGELIDSLKTHPDDISITVGDWNPEAGGWIRFNPMDGKGIADENVADFRYVLVESDSIPIDEQETILRELKIPIATLTYSGGRSEHAIVNIDAMNEEEYRERVDFLFNYLEKNNFPVDRQSRNPSRLSRMPGLTRNGKCQHLIATNIGCSSWLDWKNSLEQYEDGLPGIESLETYKTNPPDPPDELIEGILRRGHKLGIAGPSKAGKSFLAMELCIAIAEGKKWLGFQCRKGKVLYINLEIDPASAICRFIDIYEALGLPMQNMKNIEIWNLRGHTIPMDELVRSLINRAKDRHYDAIVIDPIYKVLTGDENNATAMATFCNLLDKICTELGCAVIYCHHHSKGAQGSKRAMDRASGSGVFARDPDALLDIIQLELPNDVRDKIGNGNITAWRMESSLREFPNITPINFWFQWPIHIVDSGKTLKSCGAEGSREANLAQSSKRTTKDQRRDDLDIGFDVSQENGTAKLSDIVDYIGLSEKTVRRYLKEFDSDYTCANGIVTRKDTAQT